VAAAFACLVVLGVLAFSGWALLAVAAVVAAATLNGAHRPHRQPPVRPAARELCGSR
jgi:hypothetical protein